VPIRDVSDEEIARRVTEVARRTWSSAAVSGIRRIEGGVSSLTYSALLANDDGSRDVVIKLAPPGLEPVRNRDVLRQAHVLDLLAPLDGFPVPAVLLRDVGAPPDFPPLFVMELRPGQAYEPLLDVAEDPPSAEEIAARQHAAACALGRLHSRTPTELGLADEQHVPVIEELRRWERLFETVDPDIAAGHDELSARLAERIPDDVAPRLVHGDYRAANMLFVGPDLEAVIDWEIWSVGDPRPDLSWLLMHTEPAHVFHLDRSPADLEAARLMPSAGDLLETYLAERRNLGATDADLDAVTTDLPWFLGVGHYKVASTIAAIWKRERKREQPDPKLRRAAERLDAVLAAGHAALDQT
jgi:aminoglycoside phosphotransferase (APT) family kinase protein